MDFNGFSRYLQGQGGLSSNQLIALCYWFNPLSFFQNKLNKLSQSHYVDYKNYRKEIQRMIDNQIRVMVLDTWNAVEVDKDKYLDYQKKLM